MDPLGWSISLFAIGLVFIVLEVFVPSGGVLSVLAVLSLLASIVVGFMDSTQLGAIMLVITLFAVPATLYLGVWLWPKTRLGRRIIRRPDPSDVLPDSEHYRELHALVGRYGHAKTKMLPAGAITLDNRTYDAISEGKPIEAGQSIHVTAIRTNRIVVRPVDQIPSEPEAESEMLSQPLDSLGLESLDD